MLYGIKQQLKQAKCDFVTKSPHEILVKASNNKERNVSENRFKIRFGGWKRFTAKNIYTQPH